MRYPNLAWAARQHGLTHYRVAAGVGLSESKFSRGLTGRLEFTDEERENLAALLCYPASWLFQEIVPPERLQKPSTMRTCADRPKTQRRLAVKESGVSGA
jgi:hypothetical protein